MPSSRSGIEGTNNHDRPGSADRPYSPEPAWRMGTDYEQGLFSACWKSAPPAKHLTAGIRTDADGRRNYAKGPHAFPATIWQSGWCGTGGGYGGSQVRDCLGRICSGVEIWRIKVTAVGEGYVWPNITIASDGFQCEVDFGAFAVNPNTPLFYYIGSSRPVTVSGNRVFERMQLTGL